MLVNIAFCTFCTSTLFAQMSTFLLVISLFFHIVVNSFIIFAVIISSFMPLTNFFLITYYHFIVTFICFNSFMTHPFLITFTLISPQLTILQFHCAMVQVLHLICCRDLHYFYRFLTLLHLVFATKWNPSPLKQFIII